MNVTKKIIKIIKRTLHLQPLAVDKNLKSGLVSVAPYGGMFFHKDLIRTIGYPEEKYYVYADDHDWSYNITKGGGSIYFLLDSKIEDIDTSWHLSQKNTSIFKIIPKQNPFRIFYATRNRVYFEKEHLVDNLIIYHFNRIIFQTVLLLFCLTNLSTYVLFCKAVSDGLNKKMGINDNIPV